MSAVALFALLMLQAPSSVIKSQPASPFADHPRFDCAPMTARTLPGDYYFCEGTQALKRGKSEAAISHYEISAGWGDKRAMFNMGMVYYRGIGIPANKPLGIAWLALSAERADSQMQREVLASALKEVDPRVRAEADTYWNQLKLKYADRVALSRAQSRYEHETRSLRAATDRDPAMSVWVSRLTPSSNFQDAANTGDTVSGSLGSGVQIVRSLDEAAEEVILRPRKGDKNGRVTSGPLIRRAASKSDPKQKPTSDKD